MFLHVRPSHSVSRQSAGKTLCFCMGDRLTRYHISLPARPCVYACETRHCWLSGSVSHQVCRQDPVFLHAIPSHLASHQSVGKTPCFCMPDPALVAGSFCITSACRQDPVFLFLYARPSVAGSLTRHHVSLPARPCISACQTRHCWLTRYHVSLPARPTLCFSCQTRHCWLAHSV